MGQGANGRIRGGLIERVTEQRQSQPATTLSAGTPSVVLSSPVSEVPSHMNFNGHPVARPVSPVRRIRRTAVITAAEECIGCGVCVEACPTKAITMEKIAVIDSPRCVGCGMCVAECPNSVLELVELKPAESQ